jgi:hypothetical protein
MNDDTDCYSLENSQQNSRPGAKIAFAAWSKHLI